MPKIYNAEQKHEYYLKNRQKRIEYQRGYNSRTNYACQKTEERRKVLRIKSLSRKRFPLAGKTCEFCSNHATERHHFTSPIEWDKINFVCHECHQIKNKEMRNHIKMIEGYDDANNLNLGMDEEAEMLIAQ